MEAGSDPPRGDRATTGRSVVVRLSATKERQRHAAKRTFAVGWRGNNSNQLRVRECLASESGLHLKCKPFLRQTHLVTTRWLSVVEPPPQLTPRMAGNSIERQTSETVPTDRATERTNATHGQIEARRATNRRLC